MANTKQSGLVNKQTKLFNKNIKLANTLLTVSLLLFSVASIFAAAISILGMRLLGSNNHKLVSAGSNSDTLASIDAAKISLSISNATGSSSGPDIAIQSPSGGGVTTGYHTLNVVSNSENGYVVNMSVATNGTDLKTSDSKNTDTIPSTTATLSNPAALPDNTWGVALPNNNLYANFDASNNATKFAAVPAAGANIMSKNSATAAGGDSQNIVFGVNLQNGKYKAGTYSTEVTYTATASLPSAPTITTIQPSAYTIGDNNDSSNNPTINIIGTNLDTAYEAFIDFNRNGTMDTGEECTNLNVSSSTKLTCDVPKITDNTRQGTYPVIVNTQASANVRNDNGFSYIAKSVCENGNSNNDCQVDTDANMIPVKYDSGKWVKADVNAAGGWYDYGNKKWANAVTVASDKVNTYKNATAGTEIPNNDVLGYWVYIPRYAYEVMRPDATDRVVPEQNFSIKFETADSAKYTKKSPATSCNANIKTANDMWNNGTSISSAQYDNPGILAKDYRTECGISRDYHTSDDSKANSTTWATHPAFTFGNKELNGFWIAKFELTGKRTAPTVKPNQHANVNESIGNFYTMIKSMGVTDDNNKAGNTVSGLTTNSHNLDTYHASLLRNDQWGATAYLSASSFGAGVNKVKNNGAYVNQGTDADGDSGDYGGITGCGPNTTSGTPESADDDEYYNKGTTLSTTTIESPTACNSNTDYAYNGPIGQLASATGNIYGVYDMAGGVWEYVAGSYTTTNDSPTGNIATAMSEPYVNLYRSSDGFSQGAVAWQDQSGEGTNDYRYNFQICKWSNCGAQALHETRSVQSVTDLYNGWGSDRSTFVHARHPWFLRGGHAHHGSGAGVFAVHYSGGSGWVYDGSRAALQ